VLFYVAKGIFLENTYIVKKISLVTEGLFALVDDEDFEYINKYSWYLVRGRAATFNNGKTVYMYRLIMNPAKDMEIDHINHDKLDNRKANLRVCTRLQNTWNSKVHKDNVTGFRGVSLQGDKYMAQVSVDGDRVFLGRFDSPKEAASAYNKFATENRGEFAYVNSFDTEGF